MPASRDLIRALAALDLLEVHPRNHKELIGQLRDTLHREDSEEVVQVLSGLAEQLSLAASTLLAFASALGNEDDRVRAWVVDRKNLQPAGDEDIAAAAFIASTGTATHFEADKKHARDLAAHIAPQIVSLWQRDMLKPGAVIAEFREHHEDRVKDMALMAVEAITENIEVVATAAQPETAQHLLDSIAHYLTRRAVHDVRESILTRTAKDE